MSVPAPLLVFAWGNPSRGDDALGPLFAERASARLTEEIADGLVEFLTDFQLQIEHALDLEGRQQVIFVDASASCAPPFAFSPADAADDGSYTTHSLSPGGLLHVAKRVIAEPLPASWVLAIRGSEFELGAALSEEADKNLQWALEFFASEVFPSAPGRFSRARQPESN